LIRRLGAGGIFVLRDMGRMFIFLGEICRGVFYPPFRLRLILKHIFFIGVRSVSVITLTSLFTGMVLALQGYYSLRQFGAEGLLGAAVALSLIRELGPVLSALMVTARAGSAITAEIGIMAITEQIDALHSMAVNPLKYLVVPRILAAVIAVPLLCALFDVIGIGGGYLVGVKLLGVSEGAYFGQMKASVVWKDVNSGFWKSVSFGLLLTWIACYKGYFASHGAEGVSKATTESVVLASVCILVWDYFMTSVLL
jgi:phospholipid/cholesterol/gamma-HCH transport system permease protein